VVAAADLSGETMQTIALEMGFSATSRASALLGLGG
jgi:hypothetical protein